MDPEAQQRDQEKQEEPIELFEPDHFVVEQAAESIILEPEALAGPVEVITEVTEEEPKDEEVDSELEELKEQERKAEEKVLEQSEALRPYYQNLLENQKARNSIYVGYLAELRAINLRYEAQYSEFFARRTALTPQIEGFWLTILKNNPVTGETIVPKDEQLLRHLKNVSYSESKHGRYTELIFDFEENPYIVETRLVKPFELDSNDEIESLEGTKITWKGEDFTMNEVKTKKKRKGKPVKITTKSVPCESFFNLFKTIEDIHGSDSEDQEDFEEDDIDICLEIKDELIPYAFFWYLNVKHNKDESEDEEDVKESIKALATNKPDPSGSKPSDCKNQ